jgi:hypothetical protein
MHLRFHTLLLGAGLLAASASSAQSTRPSTRPTTHPAAATVTPEDDVRSLLDKPFISQAAGIAFKPPVGGVEQRRLGVGDQVPFVTYTNTEERWTLKATMVRTDKPMKLLGIDDPNTPADEAMQNPGLLDEAVFGILRNAAGTEILRKDVINVGRHDVGLLISRNAVGAQVWLRQQAFIRKGDQFFYLLDFTSPSGRAVGGKADEAEPTEEMAVAIFNAILDSVTVLDQRHLEQEVKNRVYATLAWMVNVPGRIDKAVKQEQCFRYVKDGKDVGWSFVAEDVTVRKGKPGVLVASMTFQRMPDGSTIEVPFEAFSTVQRQGAMEEWITTTIVGKDGKTNFVNEAGQSAKFARRQLVQAQGQGENPTVRQVEEHKLTVQQMSRVGKSRVERPLPEFYLPQAMSFMLPRLVPLDQPKQYVFGTWVSAEQQLIMRYIDVEREREVTFNGKTFNAVPVRDRITLEGKPTIHYLSPKGEYLGCETPSTGMIMVPAELEDLKKKWPEADIGRPKLLDAPKKGE